MIIDIQAERGEGKTTTLGALYRVFRETNPYERVLVIFPSRLHARLYGPQDENTTVISADRAADYLRRVPEVPAIFVDETQTLDPEYRQVLQEYGQIPGTLLVQTWTAAE